MMMPGRVGPPRDFGVGSGLTSPGGSSGNRASADCAADASAGSRGRRADPVDDDRDDLVITLTFHFGTKSLDQQSGRQIEQGDVLRPLQILVVACTVVRSRR
jgi:hypothetical protein